MPLIPASEWLCLRQRASSPPFEAAMRKLRRNVEAFVDRPMKVPGQPGGYYHDYFCPQHGGQLVFSPTSPTQHRCPADGAVLRGSRYDAAWRWFVNNQLSEGTQQAALLWRLEGNDRFLQTVIEILSGYARHYAGYANLAHDGDNPGVATYTTLDESVWLLPLAWAFDFIRESLPSEEMATIADKLFIPAAEHLVQHHLQDVHNFTCWHNAAIGTVGLIFDRKDLIDFAIRGEFGFEAQLRDGVLKDGLWFEGSFSYHFYALWALLALANAARYHQENNLCEHPTLRAMLLAPIQCAYPDSSLPATNDCWYFTSLVGDVCHGVPPATSFYELGYSSFGDPLFGNVLRLNYRQQTRDSLQALLYGKETISQAEVPPLSSIILPDSGYAILRRSETPGLPTGQYLFLKYGPHGEVHGHPDKLNLLLYAYGQRLSPDLGTPGYGLRLSESWYRQTICHNTVTIDGRSQPAATGRLHAFRTDGPFQIADAGVVWRDDSYAGVSMRRSLLARPDYFLDVFLVQSDRVCQLDWIYHNVGTVETSVTSSLRSLSGMEGFAYDGYQNISDLRAGRTDADFLTTWRVLDVGLNLYMAGSPDTEVFTGRAPSDPPSQFWPMLLNRRTAAATAYLSVFHPYQQTTSIQAVRWLGRDLLGNGWAGCIVECTNGRELWILRQSPSSPVPEWVYREKSDERFEYCLSS